MTGMSGHEPHFMGGGLTDDWWTPLDLINKIGHFDLDPCGNKKHRTADIIYEERGLETSWFGRVWLNPPYSEVDKWIDKLISHKNGVSLVFARTDTKWCQKAMSEADAVFFIAGRIKFLKSGVIPKYTSGAPSMLLQFGEGDFTKLNGIAYKRTPNDPH